VVSARDIVVVIPDEEAPLSVEDICPVSVHVEMAAISIHIECVGIGGLPWWEECTPAYRNAIRMALSSIVECLQARAK
jgi:hypothetical protein